MSEIKSLHDAYRKIISVSHSRVGKRSLGIDYAALYAKYGLELPNATSRETVTQEARTQALYVRSNLSGWRGDEAKVVKALLDKITGKA
ncbi:hypothetical protein ACP46_gp60 [Rhizobium phage RHEph06]|uniref:Uncharacterized protein n=2 Tax=Kleczkowskavirus RHEph4 TaxID=1921526 RepID=L7TL02_9CAUD|nr:hypothetical protein ACP46_gp60 [Rhizobium phage RHEph06]YP_009598501.1 hypothetical protein FDH25_gp59 [Rhizobium phage RHEph04]AGC35821.1 hypothetical protein RHEph05_gp054 [Rhizobium phage RHEph05]QXV74938.1 hypothetical protein [Rhizobium phage RHEph26]AGC35745.1 hypothetical protein RHEph04_gp059 [Rhizobium phage RHEph04]AGC35902.1 hypothetical protein RHEph06_gp060 [Rhizobium phage RHEph06]